MSRSRETLSARMLLAANEPTSARGGWGAEIRRLKKLLWQGGRAMGGRGPKNRREQRRRLEQGDLLGG